MILKFFQIVRRVRSKPFAVIWFRLQQIVTILLWRQFNLWRRYSRRAESSVNRLNNMSKESCLFTDHVVSLSLKQQQVIKDLAERIVHSRFEIFGHEVPSLENCDFSTDWRFDYRWQPQFYKKYQFYVAKEQPFDVKFPWELSRLHYLIPVLAWQVASSVDA